MERGYLYLLIGALLTATGSLPINLNVLPFFSLEFFGYLLILMGIREMRTSAKELRNAYYFTIITLGLRFILPLALMVLPRTIVVNSLFSIFYISIIFFSLGIFFWLFKAEYMWSPHTAKRVDWLMYSIVSLVYLGIYIIVVFSVISEQVLSRNAFRNVVDVFRFMPFLYYAVLIYILVKLYLDARGSMPGFKRWG